MSSQREISPQITTTATQLTIASVSLALRGVSLRIVKRSAIGLQCGPHSMPNRTPQGGAPLRLPAVAGKSARVREQLDVRATVLLAAFRRGVRIERLVRTVPGGAEARSREHVF